MVRKIISINEDTCNGCGLCAKACHEGAIGMVNGKAKLLRDDYCDGLGDCLPACPTGAITFIEREAAAYDEEAVMASKKAKGAPVFTGCPGSRANLLQRPAAGTARTVQNERTAENSAGGSSSGESCCSMSSAPAAHSGHGGHTANFSDSSQSSAEPVSQLMQWPVQIKLVPVNAPYFDGANLLVAADCTAYAYAGFHSRFMKNRITIIGCPKLDEGDYTEKLTQIIARNDIKSVSVVRMEVPCCGGIENAVKRALQASGKFIPWQIVTISSTGAVLD